MSIFATKDTPQAAIDELIKLIFEEKADWKAASTLTGIGYSRGWLIARRWELQNLHPDLLIDTREYLAHREVAVKEAGLEFNPNEQLSYLVRELREGEAQASWGEIAVRLGMPESRVRKLFELTGKRSVGLRIGKGGRWVADRPDLYVGKHVKEGAHIPTTKHPRTIKPEELLNADKPEPVKKAPAKRKAPAKAKVSA